MVISMRYNGSCPISLCIGVQVYNNIDRSQDSYVTMQCIRFDRQNLLACCLAGLCIALAVACSISVNNAFYLIMLS